MAKAQAFQPDKVAQRLHNMALELRAQLAAWGSLPEQVRRDLAWIAGDIEAARTKLEAAEEFLDRYAESTTVKKLQAIC
jgi:hypothetical protein